MGNQDWGEWPFFECPPITTPKKPSAPEAPEAEEDQGTEGDDGGSEPGGTELACQAA